MDQSKDPILMDNGLIGICPVGLNSLFDRALSTADKSHIGTQENATGCCHFMQPSLHSKQETLFQETAAKKHLSSNHS